MTNIHIITASAGSGKTYRLSALLQEKIASKKVRPEAVIGTTFTKKAAAELQERVRQRLIKEGLTGEANRLAAARLGTVNAICSGLVMDFVFEKGLFPETMVLDESAAKRELKRAMSSVMTGGISGRLTDLKSRLEAFEWVDAVESVIKLARYNALDTQALEASKKISAESISKLLGKPLGKERNPDQELESALADFINDVDAEEDTTKATAKALQQATACLNMLRQGRTLPWSDWLRLNRLKVGKKSTEHVEILNQVAALHDRHPQLMKDLVEAVTLVFDTAIGTLNAYQEHKRIWGVMDFSDQEVLALALLDEPAVQAHLKGNIDLLLVDEFQDTSPIQLAILLKLASLSKETVWVGDQKQSIYGFRGTDPALMDACIENIFDKQSQKKDRSPETLDKSWRSRPPLVCMTSEIFVRAFKPHGIPKERVSLKPATKSDPPELGHFMEWWELDSRNKDLDASAVAGGVQTLLRNTKAKVRDPETGAIRRMKAGDIGILCRTNKFCEKVAEALESINIRAILPRTGLLSTPEIRTVIAGFRLWVDGEDTLAAAELARIIHYPGKPDRWLQDLLKNPSAFSALHEAAAIVEAAGENPDSGVLKTLDAVYRMTRIRERCLSWGDAPTRLANLDALMAHAVNYIDSSAAEGVGCTPAGLIAHLNEMAGNGEDTQALLAGDDAVTVVTLHSAKGLEWPVTIMSEIGKTFDANPLGVRVMHDKPFNMQYPLADRWLRYWLFPYHPKNKNTLFQHRMGQHPSNEEIVRQHERQELRVLYVGWTRARDRLILAGREKEFSEGILGLLTDEKGNWLLSEPKGGKAKWAGKKIPVQTRSLLPVDAEPTSASPGTDYVIPDKTIQHPPVRLTPSSMEDIGEVIRIDQIGERIPIIGNPEMDIVGNAFHAFFAADRSEFDDQERLDLATGIVQRWQLIGTIDPCHLVQASHNLRNWAEKHYPNAIWRREWPMSSRLPEGTVVSGFSDLMLEVGDRFVVIDHKTFAGNKKEAAKKASEFSGQLKAYRDILHVQNEGASVSCYIHYPIVGIIVQIDAEC
jgi:ATP-dependent helicase/nuclease subunit A